ncbi:hypothetical protein N7478_007232 [Penicillium angulare]|uniref:uncharacterized protein n=1 Tax=Penicillium angulare TaxID=116970 RepID=UPI00253F8813|nr:uncharacterized protein N7478_007232 [Penicillium angulare]KAJ5281860.1 hypothetical protein N7478_007232 [Penicillium angulare]
MFRLLPWPSAIGGNKIMGDDVKMLAPNCAGVNTLSLPKLKRKRSDSSPSDAPATTKLRVDAVFAPSSELTPSPSVTRSDDSVASPVAYPPAQAAGRTMDVDRLRDTITAQLSLEVLLKHNELRLIDQEIAKCQVSLEQLRRCAEIPYPGSSVTGPSADVSSGTGASVWVPGNGPAPMSPAPWGVTEGPYSRHYSRWLLPDPRFDGGEVESGLATGASGYQMAEGRSTRGNPMDFSALAGKTRPSRGLNGSRLQSLPTGYPIVKEKAGPMLIRRKSDQVLVKLVCLDCRRDNFSSTQGFINHCRIAHNRNFASHDAAAMASGEPVEVDESGAVIGGRSEPTTTTPSTVSTPGHVHPLIRSTQIPTTSSLPTPRKESVTPRKPSEVNPTIAAAAVATPPATVKREPVKAANPSFMPSPATPHLSALMRKRGLGLNMNKLVEEARAPVDLSDFSDGESDVDESARSSTKVSQDSTAQQGPQAARQPMRMPTTQAASERTESRKALQLPEEMTPTRPQAHQQPSLFHNLSSLHGPNQTSPMDTSRDTVDHPANLSPNTIESNQAPSLVSDDEDDYEAASDSDSPDSDHEEEFRHIEVQDDERTTAPSAPTTESKPGPSLKTSLPPTAAPLSKPMKQSRPNHLPTMPSFNDRGRDDQQFNPMLDRLQKQGQVNFMRPDFNQNSHPQNEDPSKNTRDNNRNQSPPKK